jgi:hypothetical protein
MDTYAGNNEDSLSLHKYLYGADNPVNMVDPNGHDYFEALEIGMALASFDGFSFGFSASRLADSGPVVVDIAISTSDAPYNFHTIVTDVGNNLQTQLSDSVFNNLATGQTVQIKAHEGEASHIGWTSIGGKREYDCEVKWVKAVLTGQSIANSSRKGHTVIDLTHLDTWYSTIKKNISTQTWVNILAHESIWLSAGGNYDPNPLEIWKPKVEEYDIASPSFDPVDQFGVSQNSRATLINEFGFKSN